MQWLLNFVNKFFGVLWTFGKWILDGALLGIKSTLYYIYDGLLTLMAGALTSIDLSAFVASYAMDWAGLPGQLIYVVNACGVPQCASLLVAAIIIRKLIDLIPGVFTRV